MILHVDRLQALTVCVCVIQAVGACLAARVSARQNSARKREIGERKVWIKLVRERKREWERSAELCECWWPKLEGLSHVNELFLASAIDEQTGHTHSSSWVVWAECARVEMNFDGWTQHKHKLFLCVWRQTICHTERERSKPLSTWAGRASRSKHKHTQRAARSSGCFFSLRLPLFLILMRADLCYPLTQHTQSTHTALEREKSRLTCGHKASFSSLFPFFDFFSLSLFAAKTFFFSHTQTEQSLLVTICCCSILSSAFLRRRRHQFVFHYIGLHAARVQ